MSGGRFRIEVLPGGQIMPPFECFDAASKGTIEAFMATAAVLGEKEPAIEWFTTIPFGMNPEGMTAWFYQGDGLKLWEETYAAFNLVPRPPGRSPRRWRGWFRKKINTIGDFKGLRMRIGRISAARSSRKAGATAVLTPAADIYAALERGVIDAAECVAPYDDMKLGLHRTARYYYYPGWHEPGTDERVRLQQEGLRGATGRSAADARPCVAAVQVHGLTDYHTKNAIALERLRTEFKGKVEILRFPAPVLRDLRKLAAEVVREESEKTPHGPEGARVLHEVPGARGPLGPRRRGRLPSARGGVRGPRYVRFLLIALFLINPFAADAQPARKPYRIGVVNEAFAATHPTVEGLKAGLEIRGSPKEGTSPSTSDSRREMRRGHAGGGGAPEGRRRSDRDQRGRSDPGREGRDDTVPIVFTLVGDPLVSGLVRNLAEPEANVTGSRAFRPSWPRSASRS